MSSRMYTRVILVTGKIGSGKSTLGEWMCNNAGSTTLAFADKLKEIAAAIGGFPVQWAYDRVMKDNIVPLAPPLTVGRFLQILGTEIGRQISSNIWARHLIHTIRSVSDVDSDDLFVVTDCRFPNEVEEVKKEFPKTAVFHLTREDPTLLGSRDANHPSETGVIDIVEKYGDRPWFFTIDNHEKTIAESIQLYRFAYQAYLNANRQGKLT